jgi:hypothetical protein
VSKICLKRGFGLAVTILARPCEILVSREVSSRKVGLARSLCETQLYLLVSPSERTHHVLVFPKQL